MSSQELYFFKTIEQLRNREILQLYSGIHPIIKKESDQVINYLKSEFENERLEFLNDCIDFHPESALWAAKLVYHSGLLLIIRENTTEKISSLIHPFKGELTTSAILSADLMLRFLPPILDSLKIIDVDDPLIPNLEQILHTFHYSAIGYFGLNKTLNWENELDEPLYRKLYLERIIEKKSFFLAEQPYINKLIKSEFGINKDYFWKELNYITEDH
ncbi:hypothetical protein O2K51_04220 [Apibacter raozihei]|uniref:hypothetical protein n=1 Tax=Apibacter raozihei TaxID=2500547 RepID=UPI000FE39317|nr:hypothetical protein [Apibacter raozihei]